MSSPADRSQAAHSSAPDVLTIQQIIQIIPALIDSLSASKDSLLRSTCATDSAPAKKDGGGEEVLDSTHHNSRGIAPNGSQEMDNSVQQNGEVSSNERINNSAGDDAEKDSSKTSGENVSCWGKGFSNTHKDQNAQQTDSKSGNNDSNNHVLQLQHLFPYQLERLKRDLNYIQGAFTKLKALEVSVSSQMKELQKQGDELKTLCCNENQSPNMSSLSSYLQSKINSLSKTVLKLKLQIPLPHKMSTPGSDAHDGDLGNDIDARHLVDGLLKLHENRSFFQNPDFRDVLRRFRKLGNKEKLCLMCLTAFPENAEIKKRLLTYWWVGEGFVDPSVDEQKTIEDIAGEILEVFLSNGFIESIFEKRMLVGYRMQPLIRSLLITLANEIGFFCFDHVGRPKVDLGSSLRACLVTTEGGSSRHDLVKRDPDKLHALFNVSEAYPDFKLDWFERMKNVNVLSLGRWQSRPKHHIEVEDTEFLKGLKNMKYLRYFSLQGVSRITHLPPAICSPSELRILDLSAVHNLEALPSDVSNLKKLTHLDISKCYMMDHMPKGLASLTDLQVLKGFVISDKKSRDSCGFRDLVGFSKLRKLSIYISEKNFPETKDLEAFQSMTALRILSIAWGGISFQDTSATDKSTQRKLRRVNAMNERTIKKKSPGLGSSKKRQEEKTAPTEYQPRTQVKEKGLPAGLEKLDLQCFPDAKPPSWLMPGKLKNLKKLYLRGGNLQNLEQHPGKNDEWNVETLRLKFMRELKMNWRELRRSFPKLTYLEKVNCPMLTFFPCDESGVWFRGESVSKQE